MVVFGSLLAPTPAGVSASASALPSILAAPEAPPPVRRRRRWILDAALLLLLAIGGFVVWYSKLRFEARLLGVREWVKVHILH